MKLVLDTPFDPGMNDPGQTYPEIYITTMTDNRTAGNFTFIYEAGAFQDVALPNGDDAPVTRSTWVKGPGMLSQVATVSGDDYTNATTAAPLVDTDTAYASIIRLLYMKLINAGLKGTITET